MLAEPRREADPVFEPKPHVSSALQHLRFTITTAGGVLVLALITQMFILGFVHYTDARWTVLQPVKVQSPELRVVETNTDSARSLTGRGSQLDRERTQQDAEAPGPVPADVNRVLNRTDRWFHVLSDLARAGGSVAAVVLALMMLMGVAVAGGASVPGVEKIVTASTWSLVVALVCLPTASMLPGLPFAGALPSYEWLTASSEALRHRTPGAPTGAEFLASALVAPLIVVVLTSMIVIRFHRGVEQGVIATSVSELDEKLRREMSSIKLGAVTAPRSVGALNHAIGEPLSDPLAAALPGIPSSSLERRAGERRTPSDRRINEPTTGESLRRPI